MKTIHSHLFSALALALTNVCAAAPSAPSDATVLDESAPVKSVQTFGRSPLSFEANQGQTDASVKFLSRGRGYTLFLTPTEAVLSLKKGANLPAQPNRTAGAAIQAKPILPQEFAVLSMRLADADPNPPMTGLEPLPTTVNYFVGNDPEQWRENIPTYAHVKYQNVYPGVDLVYYGSAGQLEFDFIVAPGADPQRIQLSFEGANELEIDPQGDLVLRIAGGELRQHKPLIYQQDGDARHEIPGRYVLKDERRVAFDVDRYDHAKPLIIDPTLWYSTYLGGGTTNTFPPTGAFDVAEGIAVTTNGTTYVVGHTDGLCFGATSGQGAFIRCRDAATSNSLDVFVAKYRATTDASQTPVFETITFLGGNGTDLGEAIAVDTSGNAYVTGTTTSSNFPVRNAFQPGFGGGRPGGIVFSGDAFVVKLNASAGSIVYASYLGGINSDFGFGIAVDTNQNAYVTGSTLSINFPTTTGAFQRVCNGCAAGFEDAFVTKVGATGSTLVYSTYIGGSGQDDGMAIAVGRTGLAYVTGSTTSTNFPVFALGNTSAFQTKLNGPRDAFVTAIGVAGTNLLFSTYLGGSDDETGLGIAIPGPGFRLDPHVTGITFSKDFPTRNASQATNAGFADAFVTKLFAAGTSLGYSTYLGGSGFDQADAIALDATNNAYVTGFTTSTNFPRKNALQSASAGSVDAFVTQLSLTGANVFSTYFGGSGSDMSHSVAVDGSGRAYIAGQTASTNFPVINAVQSSFGGGSSDAFVAKIGGLQHPATLADLLALIESLDLSDGLARSLTAPLESAQQLLDYGLVQAAVRQLAAFVNHVEALRRSGQLDAETADLLLGFVEAIVQEP